MSGLYPKYEVEIEAPKMTRKETIVSMIFYGSIAIAIVCAVAWLLIRPSMRIRFGDGQGSARNLGSVENIYFNLDTKDIKVDDQTFSAASEQICVESDLNFKFYTRKSPFKFMDNRFNFYSDVWVATITPKSRICFNGWYPRTGYSVFGG